MRFQDIFKQEGLYKADSFKKGVAFKIDRNGVLSMVEYSNVNDLLPVQNNAVVYAGLFEKEYTKVLIIKQLFQ